MDRGVKKCMATKIVREGSHEAIRNCIREYDELLKSGAGANLENPPGLLVEKIRECLALDRVGCRWKCSISRQRDSAPPELRRTSFASAESEATESDMHLEAVRKYLGELSSEERNSLEVEALKKASSFQVKCYERATREGDTRSANRHRNMIMCSHVRDVLAQRKLET